jgi:hypothetical protein
MNTRISRPRKSFPALLVTLGFATALLAPAQQPGKGRGPGGGGGPLPPEAREQIHTLFSNHKKIRREVTETEHGYTALTESDDPAVAAALKKHVRQMEDRLEQGLMVRRWDPAFEEYVRHYKDMDTDFEKTDKGVRMTVKGRTPDAAKVARNHAKVVSAFVANGMDEHDVQHPKALQ